MNKTKERQALEHQLIALLEKAQAHLSFEDAAKGINPENYGKKIDGLPYTLWQLIKHLQIAQKDILEFSRDPDYQSPSWPEGYWPKETAPGNQTEWDSCIEAIIRDRNSFIQMLQDAEDLYAAFPHGDGQNLMREALLIADHNAYHYGQIVVIRRILNDYK